MSILRCLTCLIFLSVTLGAEEYCSLIVKVVNAQDRETEAWVTVKEPDGRIIKKENQPGGVHFCDLGIKPVNIKVGHPACNQVIIRSVSPQWGKPVTMKVIYDREPCLVDQPPVAACHILFRIKASEDRWVPGALLKLQTPYERTLIADQYGRIMVMFAAGQRLEGAFTAEGYQPIEVSIPCISENQRVERLVKLEKGKK